MTNKELQDELAKYSPDLEVLISDGIIGNFYKGVYSFQEYTDLDSKKYLDIGIGGTQVED